MAYKTLTAVADEKSASRVDLFVRDLSELPRSQVRGLFDHGCVMINDAPCDSINQSLSPGDRVAVCYDPHRRYKEKKRTWDDRTFQIVHEDDFLIVVDKAAGTLTVPTDNDDPNTLVDRVSTYLNHSRRNKVAWVVHRLDRDVSGLVVFAKQELISTAMVDQFKRLVPTRGYTAIVAGVIKEEGGAFEPLEVPSKNPRGRSELVQEEIKETPTQFKVLSRHQDTTVVEILLDSGQRNSIRVQFAAAGHPILGDRRCNSDDAIHPRWIRKRIALHARTLSFVHPVSENVMAFDSPLPTAMKKFVAGSKNEGKPTVQPNSEPASPWEKAKRSQK
ncbi:RluA family pseudouridine synthase [Planctomycetes bacterium K23_9]